MVTFNVAYTAPINGAGATPALTQSQVWDGLKIKVRQAQDFVSAITGCQVLLEETLPTGELQITRQVQFAPSTAHHSGSSVKEVCGMLTDCVNAIFTFQLSGMTSSSRSSSCLGGSFEYFHLFTWQSLNTHITVHYAPCRVVFQQEDDSSITNIISKGPEDKLLMSYVFEWRHADVEEGSERAKQLEEAHWKASLDVPNTPKPLI
jgi:hypothetical protein